MSLKRKIIGGLVGLALAGTITYTANHDCKLYNQLKDVEHLIKSKEVTVGQISEIGAPTGKMATIVGELKILKDQKERLENNTYCLRYFI